MEFSILYAIQNMRCAALDQFVLAVTKFTGSYGQLWLVIGALLLIWKKTRKCGIAMILSYGLVFLVGQYGLKDLVARARPCQIDQTVELLISRPSSYSFPSTHSAWAFAAATAVFLNNKKFGVIVFIAAVIIGFSRLYLFVHFPTDVLFGAVLGILTGFIAVKIVQAVSRKVKSKKRRNA